ncbi:Hypothetical predicted protein [Paramuricea clavata]|uniref:Transposable element P transposase-like RNase H domain-containing protein n=1 Tax=Paramuricea clavata TaxID=317549 RepID=A0A6S7IK17_PARCT|nr:Hypothetical predicted protein [Paramuricea clavata]
MLRYMKQQAEIQNISPAGHCGYITFDEKSVQVILCKILGVVNLGDLHEDMKVLETGKDEAAIATHLLQFMFIGSTGFKFPICYFPTIEVDPTTLYHQLWSAVFDLGEFGFKVLLAIWVFQRRRCSCTRLRHNQYLHWGTIDFYG